MNAGVTRDVWSAIAPNIETPQLKRIVTIGNRTIPFVHPEEALIAIAVLARAYLQDPPPAQFHFIVSPLVMWIWIGGLIVFGGGLIAIWPAGGWALHARAPPCGRAGRRVVGAGGSRARPSTARSATPSSTIASGKLSREDYEAVDATLRAEAVAILDRLQPVERAESEEGESEERELTPTGA